MDAVRCVVFDIDDTLYLEREYVRSGFDAVGRWAAGALGLRDVGARAWAEFESGTRGDIFDRVLAAAGHAAAGETVQSMIAVYREHAPAIAVLADARECLERLRPTVPLAAVTDGPLQSQRAKALALGLATWVDPIVFTAELGAGFGKPHPRPFQTIEKMHGATGRACVYVADNPSKDFAGPASLGWRTIRVVRAGGLHARLPSGSDVEHELPDLSTLPTLLGLA